MQSRQEGQKYNIVCLSNQIWDYPLWTNKKHVMKRLSEQGHNVIFVDPPINTGFLFFKHVKAGKWNLKRILEWTYKDENITVFSPLNFFPAFEFLSKMHAQLISDLSTKKFDKNLKTILWVYHVEIAGIKNYIDKISHDVLVYDCVDNYPAFPKYDTLEKKEKVIKQEEFLAKQADIVFATAPGLMDKLKKYNTNVHFMPNVGDFDKFVTSQNYKKDLPEEIRNLKRPIIGYTGAVDEYKFDAQLVKKLAKDYPNYTFVIIGPLALKDREASAQDIGLGDLENVVFLKSKPYSEIHKYFAGFDSFIIPYQLNDYTVGGCFPVKFHDALATGLPVVVTDLPAYAPFEDVSYISKSYNEFSQNIRKSLEEDNEQRIKQRQWVAKDNNWDGKVSKMLALINELTNK